MARSRRTVAAVWAWLMNSSAPRVGELLGAAGLLAVLGVLVYGSHLADGGLYLDDRWFHSYYEIASPRGYFSAVGEIMGDGDLGFRPPLAAMMAASFALFGLEVAPLLAWALGLAVAAAACFYWLLRSLGLERVHAGAIAALSLISPAADSTKLWITVGHNSMGLILYFVGAVLALRGFLASGRRALLLHGVSLSLYVLSVLLYEAAALAMLGSVLLYRLRTPWRVAVRRWLVDIAVVGSLVVVKSAATEREVSVGEQLDIAVQFAQDAVSLVLSAGVPNGSKALLLPVLALVSIGVVAAMVSPPWGGNPAIRDELRRWVVVAGVATLGIAGAYLVFVPTGSQLGPLAPGTSSRANTLAVFPIVTLLYALFMLAGTLALRFLERWREASVAFALAMSIVLGVAYLDRVGEDKSAWAAAATVTETEIEALESALPDPVPGSTIYSVGNQPMTGPGLPGLIWWDLYGAGRLLWDPSVTAVPIPAGIAWSCGKAGLSPNLTYAAGEHVYELDGAYGRSYVVDIRTGDGARIDGAAECRAVTTPLVSGQLLRASEPLTGIRNR